MSKRNSGKKAEAGRQEPFFSEPPAEEAIAPRHIPEAQARRRKHNLWGWRVGLAAVFLLILFYACHPLIFSRPSSLIVLEAAEDEPLEYQSYVETNAVDWQPEFSAVSAEERNISPVPEAVFEPVSDAVPPPEPEFTPADDMAYLQQALNSTEDSLTETAQDEKSYELYEEPLPENIIDDENDADKDNPLVHYNHKNIKDIPISLHHKPRYFGDKPVIAVVIDDMGVNVGRTHDIISLRAPLTSSFLTYGLHLSRQIEQAKAAGHEIMAHVPMEPHKNIYVAPDGLTVNMEDDVLKQNFEVMLAKFPGIRGINNHMGSKFTENRQKMSDIMEILRKYNLFFLDSKTTPKSVGKEIAGEYGVEYAHRHVFLDNQNDKAYILKQLAAAEHIAAKNGYAVAIGHPKSQTYEALKTWLPTLENKNLKLVHMSEIVQVLN